MSLNEQFAFLSPVQYVKVTKQNLEEVAEWCGGKVATIESRRKPGTMEKYVWVPTPANSKNSSAYPGMYVTRRVVFTIYGEMVVTWSVFAGRYFDKNYFETPEKAIDATWAKKLSKAEADVIKADSRTDAPAPTIIVNVQNPTDAKGIMEAMAGGGPAKDGGHAGVDRMKASDIPRDANLNG